MKKIVLVSISLLSLSTFALASDNCYVLEKGSDSWLNCKEDAAESQRTRDQLDQNLRDLYAQDAQSSANDSLAEQINIDAHSKNAKELLLQAIDAREAVSNDQ